MVTYTWKKEAVPLGLPIKQVYGVVFSDDGRVLLRFIDGKYKLTGGKPWRNESFEETLQREYVEELNLKLKDIHYLGYLLVNEPNLEPYAQVRMIGKIEQVFENRPDVDTGEQYERFLSSIDHVKKYLNYPDEAGNMLIDDAIRLATQKYSFKKISVSEEFI